MKRIALFLACALLSLTLCSCAIEPISDSGTQSTEPSHVVIVSGPENHEASEDISSAPSLEDGEAVLFDTDECSLTVLKAESRLPDDFTIEFLIENKTDTELYLYCDTIGVNGWQIDTFYYEVLEPGMTLRDEIEYFQIAESDVWLESLDEVVMVWEVSDTTDILIYDCFTFYASGLAPEEIEVKERTITDGEMVICNDERFTFVVTELTKHGVYGPEVICYLENKTDEIVNFGWDDTSVNGWQISSYFGKRMLPECRTFMHLSLLEGELKLCGIENIDELCFVLSVMNSDYGKLYASSVSLYPTGHTADDIPAPQRVPKDGETVLTDDEHCTAIIEPAVRMGDAYVYGIYIHNKTGESLETYITDVVINGDCQNSFFRYDYLPAEGHTYLCIDIYDSELANSVSPTPESLEFKMELGTYDGYSTDTFFDETVTAGS